MTSISGTFSPWLALREASCHVMSCPVKRPMWQETNVFSRQPVSTGGLSTALVVNLEPGLPLVEPCNDCRHQLQPVRDTEPEAPSKVTLGLLTFRN